MPENVNEKSSHNQLESTSPDLANKNNSVNSTSKIEEQDSKNIETHHHPQINNKQKRWKQYFLEFLMIFLAVTLGFFAESFREHRVNKEIERQNIVSLVKNLEEDSISLSDLIEFNKKNNLIIDSLSQIQGAFSDTLFQKPFLKFASQLTWIFLFNSQNSTFQQMQSSGTMRLISNPIVRERILQYEALNEIIKGQGQYVEVAFKAAAEDLYQITDIREGINNLALRLKGDSQFIQLYINHKISEKSTLMTYISMLQRQLANARSMISFFKKEYEIVENINSIYDNNEFVTITPLPIEAEKSLKSLHSDFPTLLRIKNNTPDKLTVHWINYKGEKDLREGHYRQIESGKTLDQETYATHPFIVFGSKGKCYGIYTANILPSIAIIKD